jgi:hypothetical protein
MSDLRRPRVHSSPKRLTIEDGPVKNSGEILPLDQIACQTAIAASAAIPPTINRSCL